MYLQVLVVLFFQQQLVLHGVKIQQFVVVVTRNATSVIILYVAMYHQLYIPVCINAGIRASFLMHGFQVGYFTDCLLFFFSQPQCF